MSGVSATAPTVARARPSARSGWTWLVPGLIALVVGCLLITTPVISFSSGSWFSPARLSTWLGENHRLTLLDALLGLATVAGVTTSRFAPRLALVLLALPFAFMPLLGAYTLASWLGVGAVAALAAYDGRWSTMRWALALACVVLGVFVYDFCFVLVPGRPEAWYSGSYLRTRLTRGGVQLAALAAVVLMSAAAGLVVRARRRSTEATVLMQRATEVESAATERARLARDLHDVVAHHISLVVARADGAPFQYPRIDDDARVVLKAIGEDARGAMGELRQVLAVLRRSEDADPVARAPQPTAADTLALVEQAREAGQQVTLAEGAADVVAQMPAAPGYVLYRAVQEALTNARRHAPNQPVELALTRAGDVAGLTVINPVSASTATHRLPDLTGGRGLIGMRERVEALGGALSTGVSDGVFRVVATIPVGAS